MRIAILGAGLMGRVLGLRLYQSGYTNLTLIDKDSRNGKNSPAFIAAGMLAPFSESVMGGKLIYDLGKNSLNLWQLYLAGLKAHALCSNNGTLLLASHNFAAEARHYLNKITFNTQTTYKYYMHLSTNEIAKLEPELASFSHGYYLPDEGGVNARKIFISLGKYLLPRVNWLAKMPVADDCPNGIIRINNKTDRFDLVLDCRGLGAKGIFNSLRGVRGEIIRVFAPDVNILRPVRLFHPRHNIYIMPYEKNHYIIGASEIEVEDYSPISVRTTLELLSTAYNVHTGFAEARILEAKSNCRPTLKNNLPQISVNENSIAINGLYRHGFLLAPALAENIVAYLKSATKLNTEIWSE